jgi:hypothetical protein
MQAVEFDTHAKNGIIKIPDEYRNIADGEVRIIILKQEKKPETSIEHHRKMSELKKLLKQIRDRNIFQSIDDPVKWQRSIRNEW